jgi:monofunctional biosynthetic peptidoglycan transglycosylase
MKSLLLVILAVLAGCGPRNVVDPIPAPAPIAATPLATTRPASAPAPEAPRMVLDFKMASAVAGWLGIDDSVIGGKSQGAMKAGVSGAAVFEGNISQHRGGFVTVRCPNGAFDLSGFAGLEVRLRGDGKNYQVLVKTEAVDNGFEYLFYFMTRDGAWQTVRLAFGEFKANFRGINLSGLAKLDPAKIVSMGFLIANYQEGPFRLEVESIKAYKN